MDLRFWSIAAKIKVRVLMIHGRDAPIDRLPIIIGRVSVNCDWLVIAKMADHRRSDQTTQS